MIVTVILIIIVLILMHMYMEPRWRIKNYPPGPYPWPFFGSSYLLKRLIREYGTQHRAFTEISKRYNTNVVAIKSGNRDVFVVSGNKVLRKVLTNDEFEGRPWNEFIKIRNFGKKSGITMNDGADWKQLRGWSLRNLKAVGFGKHLMSDLINDELIDILEKLNSGTVRQMKLVLAPAVINVLWTLITGKRFPDIEKLQHFSNLLERRSQAFDMLGGFLTTFPWLRYIAPNLSGYNLLLTFNNDLKNFLMDQIIDHKKRYIPGTESDLIDMFLREAANNSDNNTVFTDDQLMMLLVDFFLAGFNNTTATLDFLFLHMIVFPEVQRKLHEEIDSVIQSDRLPELSDRSKLPYTEAVITEVHRMWVIFPIIGPRRTLRETKLDNYTIPKDSFILMNTYSVHLDPALYPDPYLFKPERFLNNGVYQPDENLVTFGHGRRKCPGEVLAKSALFLLFVGVMKKFKLQPASGKGPSSIEIVPGLSLSPKSYEVTLIPR